MARPAGQEGSAKPVPPASDAGDDPLGLAPWLKEMPAVPLHPLMAHPMAAFAAATAIGFSMTGQFAGMMLGVMQGAADRAKATLDEAEKEAKAKTPVATAEPPVGAQRKPRVAKARPAAAKPVKAKPAAAVETPPVEAKTARGAKAKPRVAAEVKRPAAPRKVSGKRAAKADDLKAISGIGPKLEQVLNDMGVRTYADIAAFSASDVERIEAELGLGGRIARDGWVERAKELAKGRG